MDKIKIERTWLQGSPVQVDNLMGNAFVGEAGAHEFLISGKDNAGNVVPITGTITGKFLSSTMTTFALSGYVTEGVASVTLPSECYGAPGQFVVSIFATNGSTTTCIYCGVGSIFRTSTAAIAYPTTTLPDLTLLINQLDDVIASFPADLSHLLGAIAPTFVDNQPFYAGQYVWNNQVLYRFTVDHPAGSWAGSADTVVAVLGTELNSTVRYTQQVLTDAQKTVARTNIDAADADDVTDLELTTVQVTPQTFDANSKSQARSNIGAASSGDLSALSTTVNNQGVYIGDISASIGTVPTGETVEGQIGDLKSAIDPLMDSNSALTADYQCVGYYYNSGAKQIRSSANLETFKYNIPDDCVAVRIQSNFYASQIIFSNTDTTSATFPSMSINLDEIALRPAMAPGSATNVDITYIINDDNRYKYLYVPHYIANTNPVVVTATLRGEISTLTYGKIDAAGRYRRNVPTGEDIFISAGFTSGYILTDSQGGTTANPNYGYTDYINIEGESFTLDGISGNGFSVVYDENKNPLGSGAISLFFDKNDRPDGTKYIRFNVYLANLPSVKMNVYETEWITYITPSQVVGGYTDITVGTGKQFASVVDAVEYANSIASDYNTVNVYIYPGTYDIIGEYNLSDQVSSWNGLTLADHVNLIGVGSPDKVVLNGELPTDISSYAFDRNNVSTLNFWKNNSIKNLTITAKNMRYCLHNEDGKVYAVENAVETIDNCVFIYYENDTGIISSRVPIGIGAAAGRKTTFRNCVFDNQSANGNYPLLLHNNTNAEKYCEWIFESCDFIGGTMNSLKLSSAGSGQTEIVKIIGCRLPHNLRFDRQNVYTGTVCEYKVFGHGNAISGTASWDGVVESASVIEMLIG